MLRHMVLLLVLMAAPALAARGQSPAKAPDEAGAEVKAVTRAILEEVDKNSELMANLEYLCDMIGPRLTGSTNLKRANEWTRSKFEQYGLKGAKLEPWTIHRAWTRGPSCGRVVLPVEQRLLVESAGWSPGTDGPRRGPVVHLQGDSEADLSAHKGKLKGAWILLAPVSTQADPRKPKPDMNSERSRLIREYRKREKFMELASRFLEAEGIAGVLRDSDKEHGLVNMTGATANFTVARYASAFLTTESYGLIWRLLRRGPVEIEIDLKNTFSDAPVEVYNTVAEIAGAEKPDEVVILGGHIDSWDLGTGATDNGTGIMAVLEAARALQALKVRPKRTIRFVLFSGEEQGLHGSRAYAKVHQPEMAKVSGVLVHDMGTGRVTSIGLQGRYDLRERMDQLVAPFKEELKLDELSLREMGGTDHLSFLQSGVPAFAVVQDGAEYRKTHHTESDTFDKVYADEINQGAKVLAAWAYNVAMLPDLLPRDPKPIKPGMFDAPEFQQPGGTATPPAKPAAKADGANAH
jgi:carboxypeptidase Q